MKKLCPICGNDNNCGAARGEKNCWCFSIVVPPELLAQVQKGEGQQACICLECLKSYQASPKTFMKLHDLSN